MSSFDIVCKTDMQEVDNAVNSVRREMEQRYDFKGSQCSVEREEDEIKLLADDQYKLDQIHAMLKGHFTRRGVDAKVLDMGAVEAASGNTVRQKITIKQGIDAETAKKIVKEIKAQKIKVQASIRGEEVRVDGKKRDDLQAVIALVKAMPLEVPTQFVNMRD